MNRRLAYARLAGGVLAAMHHLASGARVSIAARGLAIILALPPAARGPASADELLFPQSALMTPETDEAIGRGLEYLAQRQLSDGSFGPRGQGRNVAVIGLAGMAFLASGSTPGRGEYGANIDRCLDFLLNNVSDSGLIAADTGAARGPMYGQGFATLFLCECYGMSRRAALRDRLDRALDLVIAAQNPEGGWRYTPQPRDADVSVTVCQIMALRAARNIGFAVPRETIDRGLQYVKQCQNDDGGFRYMLNQGSGESGFSRTAGGVVALYNAGLYDGPEVAAGLEYLDRRRPAKDSPHSDAYYFYGHYYAVQAMWFAGGDRWAAWYPAIREQLLARQGGDGSWVDAVSPEYGTAMACIILQTPNNYLPILQR